MSGPRGCKHGRDHPEICLHVQRKMPSLTKTPCHLQQAGSWPWVHKSRRSGRVFHLLKYLGEADPTSSLGSIVELVLKLTLRAGKPALPLV